ncbi:DUF3649 domain-containing protein [Stutzerimonas kirkiae]|uniref:Iron transporter n=1 Tax=Stutzerimonas kirkiae TaxID=2211392 RepID=A0A4Q9R8X9_9GAMM|nr:DUF3649 domain-containing protein [Stutzerimonas kirkiae]TBU96576.1 iron transporter [Stutzerimonas kirkiae]TBV02141.1 iron transporter [Stutzerimonas kirkiae]TBV08811.1 iron transporter [Stutzerimonas kirkiae]TBV15646.1 iron transporter [Stutzerimonas kirkiae]
MKTLTRYRWSVASRVFAAVFGGYALTSAITLLLALVWPLPRAQAVLAASLPSFLLYGLIVLWVFSVRSATRAWVGLAVPTLLLDGACWLLLPGGTA